SENCAHRANGCSVICVGERNATQLKSGSAYLADPGCGGVGCSEDGPSFTDGRSVSGICKGYCPQISCRAAGLNCPGAATICRSDDRSVGANDRARICIDKGSAVQVIPLGKRILPEPLPAGWASCNMVRAA